MDISRNILSDVHAKSEKRKQIPTDASSLAQAIDGGQLAYTFTVQYTGGLGAIASRFNPLVADLSASVQLRGSLSIFVNGYQAATSIGARSGLVAIEAREPPPTKVVIVGGEAKPRGMLTAAEQNEIVTRVLKGKKPSMTAANTTPAVNELRNELKQNQNTAGQANKTGEAISKFGLTETIQKSIANEVQHLADQPTTPPKIVTISSGGPRTVQDNNGRGIFRYPLGFPIQ